MNGRVRPITLFLAFSIPAFFLVKAHAQGGEGSRSTAPAAIGKAYKFDRIAEGVYYATATGAKIIGGNNPIIVNDRDVMVVDAGITPAAARALLEDLKTITDKPVRWVVNTHFHYDHTDGNSIFGPNVQIHRPRLRPLCDPESRRARSGTIRNPRAFRAVNGIRRNFANEP